jgi:gliding motility-associated-like protein
VKSRFITSILILLYLSSSYCYAQFSAGPNDTINPGVPVILMASYGQIGIPISISDDGVEGPFPIGFNFLFFGSTYTQFWVGANGWISFSPNASSSGRRDVFAVPNFVNYNPKNCILGPLVDFSPVPSSSNIFYLTVGQPPNRELVVMWCQIPLYNCQNLYASFQIILHEGSSIIENQIFRKPDCPGFNTGTLGIQNGSGTIGFAVPNRNATSWSAEKEGWQYNPVSIDSFAITSIPYQLVPLVPGNKINYRWYEGENFISDEQSIIVAPSQTTTYRATMTLCLGEQFDTIVTVVVLPKIPNAFSPNDDGINDEFRIIGLPPENVTKYNLQIFNRWGQLVFTSTNILESWDGRMNGQKCLEGLYCWAIYYEENNKIKVSNKGSVMLIR